MEEDTEFEREQLEYIRRNAQEFNVPDDTVQYPDALKQPLERPIILEPEQEKRIIEEIRRNIPSTKQVNTVKRTFSLNSYFDILSSSFIGIMEDLLNFGGNLEDLQSILTKDDRTVFLATIVIIVAVFIVMNRRIE